MAKDAGFMELITGGAATPVVSHLFDVYTDYVKLIEALICTFHTTTAELLFLCKRARPDIQVPITPLTKRVKEPDEDDWKKLARVLKYLKDTIDLVLTLSADNLTISQLWVYGSYGVHGDFKVTQEGACRWEKVPYTARLWRKRSILKVQRRPRWYSFQTYSHRFYGRYISCERKAT